jgi:hypothetical protein
MKRFAILYIFIILGVSGCCSRWVGQKSEGGEETSSGSTVNNVVPANAHSKFSYEFASGEHKGLTVDVKAKGSNTSLEYYPKAEKPYFHSYLYAKDGRSMIVQVPAKRGTAKNSGVKLSVYNPTLDANHQNTVIENVKIKVKELNIKRGYIKAKFEGTVKGANVTGKFTILEPVRTM